MYHVLYLYICTHYDGYTLVELAARLVEVVEEPLAEVPEDLVLRGLKKP